MPLIARKFIVVLILGGVLLLANFHHVGQWLQQHGVLDMAVHVRREFVTGTAVTVIIALLILLGARRD